MTEFAPIGEENP